MANTLGVCLIALSLFCCTNLSLARQVPKDCTRGPTYWCQSLKKAAECGAVGHCISTVWETQAEEIRSNDVSDRFVRLFRQLKDVKDLINPEYLGNRVGSACRDLPYQVVRQHCKDNTAKLDEYLSHLLLSEATPETMCRVVGLCNNQKLDNILALSTKTKKPLDQNPKKANTVKVPLLGSERCTWGPSYWCSNFSTGRECKATSHCVQKVWSKMEFPEDKDDICKICTDMVQQARDQLLSNETQTELKEVFEGSCKLIPVKIVAKECMKLADDIVPELVETLASQMNPQQVCSVAGLCNNARIDQLLDKYSARLALREDCYNCHRTVGVLRKKFDATSYEDFLVGLLQMCGRMGSLSDSCSMIMFSYYENIVAALKKDLTAKSVCHLSGQCAFQFHTHDEFTFPEVDAQQLKATDDVPCQFCEKLVVHLRDVLVANTTEMQFQKILKGLCKQTGHFKDECLHIVDQYYAVFYNYLVSDLKPAEICSMMGICTNKTNEDVNIAPLIPKELAVKIAPSSKLIGAEEAKVADVPIVPVVPKELSVKVMPVSKPVETEEPKIARVPIQKQTSVRILGSESTTETVPLPPLPIERMFVAAPQSKAACSFCQYFLHYIQVELSDTNNEDKIKEAVEKACDRLPQSVDAECKQFVTEYGPAVIALLVQQIDPASVCPALRLCPTTTEVRRVAINAGSSNCPLCLFAVEQLETMLKNNRSENSIRKALDGLCNHLSTKLRTQCVDFCDQYSNQLVEMLVANMNAQEICVFLKLCKDDTASSNPLGLAHPDIDKYHNNPQLRGDRNNIRKPMLPKHMLVGGGDIETNEIPDNTVGGRPVRPEAAPNTVCVICEFVLKEIDDEIKDKHNDDEIKKIVHGVCKRMPKSVKSECDQFVEKYADLVISLLAQELSPDEVCQELKLCPSGGSLDEAREEILDCAVCETVIMAVKKVLSNDKVDRNIVHIVEKSCGLLPAKYSNRCHTMMEIYGDSVIHLIEQYGTKGVCQKIGLCADRQASYVRMQRDRN
uniref:Pulmonary surfactant-associated protein B n=1 Tax=Pectinophora gossypiella TaxID=13191 RepID=A0A1E1WGK9_PECGO